MQNLNRPGREGRMSYTSDSSLRQHHHGRIEPMEYAGERTSWPFAVAVALIVLVVFFGQWS